MKLAGPPGLPRELLGVFRLRSLYDTVTLVLELARAGEKNPSLLEAVMRERDKGAVGAKTKLPHQAKTPSTPNPGANPGINPGAVPALQGSGSRKPSALIPHTLPVFSHSSSSSTSSSSSSSSSAASSPPHSHSSAYSSTPPLAPEPTSTNDPFAIELARVARMRFESDVCEALERSDSHCLIEGRTLDRRDRNHEADSGGADRGTDGGVNGGTGGGALCIAEVREEGGEGAKDSEMAIYASVERESAVGGVGGELSVVDTSGALGPGGTSGITSDPRDRGAVAAGVIAGLGGGTGGDTTGLGVLPGSVSDPTQMTGATVSDPYVAGIVSDPEFDIEGRANSRRLSIQALRRASLTASPLTVISEGEEKDGDALVR